MDPAAAEDAPPYGSPPAAPPRRASLVLGGSMFIMGACGLAYEYTFSKIATDLLGNSTRQWAIIIGVMLFFMGVGADVQKYLRGRNLVDKLVLSQVAIGVLGGIGPVALLYSYGNFPSHYVLVQYFFISAIGLLIGFEIPLITRINETYAEDLRVNLGGILKMDYIGSLAGALVWIFLLPKFFSTAQTAFVLSLCTLGVAGFTVWYFRGLIAHRAALAALIATCAILQLVGLLLSEGWASYSEQRLYDDRIVLSETSRYQHVVVTRSASGEIACYINRRLQFNSFDEHIYHELLVHPAMLIAPRRADVLVLGGGDGLAVREILKHADVESVTLVDLDPMMTSLAMENPLFLHLNQNALAGAKVNILRDGAITPAPGVDPAAAPASPNFGNRGGAPDPDLAVVNVDAAKFVEQVPGRYDVIVIDFPDPNSPELAKLYSRFFYKFVGKKLARGGIVVQQSTSPMGAREAFLCIGRTWRAAGLTAVPFHEHVPTFGEWGWWIGGRAEDYTAEDIRTALAALPGIPVPVRYLTPDVVRAALTFGLGQLDSEHDDFSTLGAPRVYDYYRQGW